MGNDRDGGWLVIGIADGMGALVVDIVADPPGVNPAVARMCCGVSSGDAFAIGEDDVGVADCIGGTIRWLTCVTSILLLVDSVC